MSISEQVKYLREFDCFGTVKQAMLQAADTIESLSAKLQAENMERSNNDLISKQELFNKIYDFVEEHRYDDEIQWTGSEWLLKKDSVISMIENMGRSADCGGWFSCKERLPEDGVDVLVWFEYFRYGEYDRLFQTKGISYTFNGEWSGFVNGQSGWNQLRIIAWQPLPEPYHEH